MLQKIQHSQSHLPTTHLKSIVVNVLFGFAVLLFLTKETEATITCFFHYKTEV